jgi:SAM-dependent methyltransferase
METRVGKSGCQTRIMPVHPAAATGFSRAADAYERGRPGYPAAAIAWLEERLGLGRGQTVVDLAAGTGKLTRELTATEATVIAVEPVAEMRALIPEGVEAVAGTAEDIPLPDGSADAVTVAQAFHWFDGEAALVEIHRVLRPGGALALIWNRRDLEHPVHARLQELMEPYRGDAPAHSSDAWRQAFQRTVLFAPLERAEFPTEQSVDADSLADRVGSVSFVASIDEPEREALLRDVRALAADGTVRLPYLTEVFLADRR